MKKTKHQKFVEKMDGLFTLEIVEYIKNNRDEAKNYFSRSNGDFEITITNLELIEYIKNQAKLNECSYSAYVAKILTFEKEENDFVLSEVSEELEALKDRTFDYSTLSSADKLLEYLEKTHPSNVLGDYAKEHNYGWYEALHEMVTEHREMKLLIQYDNGELTIGQVAEQLCVSKSEVLDFLKKHKIPYVRVDEEYLEQELQTLII